VCSCEIYPNTDAPKRRTTILEPLAAADSLDCDKYVKQTLAENSKALASVRRVLLGGGLENRRSATRNKVEAYRYNGLGDRCHHLGEYFVGSNQAATTKSKPCEMHLTTAVGTCLVTRRVVGGIRGSGLTNICG
jgi:hypothetical protein